MIFFPNAKINIGLNILRKRSDGYHDISSCFYPTGLCDALEIIPASAPSFTVTGQGLQSGDDNLVTKALALIAKDYEIPPLSIHLLKHIPVGAGLGGGSSDAAFMISGLNQMFSLDIPTEVQEDYARKLGSDCAFFIRNLPTYCYGRGDQFEPIGLSLKGYTLMLVNPGIHVSTAEAYAGVVPKESNVDLREVLLQPVSTWKEVVCNDFEKSVFLLHPQLERIKQELYDYGALYASMTGSGSTLFGIFKNRPNTDNKFQNCFVWLGELN